MIPYFQFVSLPLLGPLKIQVWGLFVALGIVLAVLASVRLAKKRGLNPERIWDLAFWVIIGAFVMARLVYVFDNNPGYYFHNPFEILAIWQGGLSVMGGFIGAAIAGVTFLQKKHLDLLGYVDTVVFGLPLGLFIGRIGCFLIHDHPGRPTSFFLGVLYPDNIARFDHGLLLSINGLLMFLFFLWLLYRRQVRVGTFLVTFLIWYGLVRFGLDFLRAYDGLIVDARYLGLTVAQYGSLMMLAVGLSLRMRFVQKTKQIQSSVISNEVRDLR